MQPYKLDIEKLRTSRGNYRTRALFHGVVAMEIDIQNGEEIKPIFTMKDYDHNGLYSFKKLYLSIGDPTEYRMAMEIFGSLEHWKSITNMVFMKELIAECREELVQRLQSEAYSRIAKEAVSAESEGARLTAQRLLLKYAQDLGKKDAAKQRVGRPLKPEQQKTLKELSLEESQVLADYERITQEPKTVN
jgi:hypothetical protein